MNKARRKKLQELKEQLETIKEELEKVQEEEEDAHYNLPESLQISERGERMYEAAELLRTACDDLDRVICDIEEAMA